MWDLNTLVDGVGQKHLGQSSNIDLIIAERTHGSALITFIQKSFHVPVGGIHGGLVFRFTFPVPVWFTSAIGGAQGASLTGKAVAQRWQVVETKFMKILGNNARNDVLSAIRPLFKVGYLARAQPSATCLATVRPYIGSR